MPIDVRPRPLSAGIGDKQIRPNALFYCSFPGRDAISRFGPPGGRERSKGPLLSEVRKRYEFGDRNGPGSPPDGKRPSAADGAWPFRKGERPHVRAVSQGSGRTLPTDDGTGTPGAVGPAKFLRQNGLGPRVGTTGPDRILGESHPMRPLRPLSWQRSQGRPPGRIFCRCAESVGKLLRLEI